MPTIFFKADFEATIKFLDYHDLSKWDDFENEDDVYQTISFIINDPDEPDRPCLFHVANNEAVSGFFICAKIAEKLYKFRISGIFKASAHKDAIRLLNSGIKPILEGVARNQRGYYFDEKFQPTLSNTDWYFSSKKSEIMSGP